MPPPLPSGWVIIGQEWAGADDGVIVMFAELVGSVRMHEEATTRLGASVNVSLDVAPGYYKVRARSFADAAVQLERWLADQGRDTPRVVLPGNA